MINHKFYVQLGANIKKYRNLRKYTQQEFADKVGITINHLGKVEVAYSKPSLDTVINIASALEISVSDLCKFD